MHVKSEAEFPKGFELILSEGSDSALSHQDCRALRYTPVVSSELSQPLEGANMTLTV